MIRSSVNSPAMKVAGVGLVLLLLLPALWLVESQIDDRSHYANSARVEIGEHWGKQQTLFGPFVQVPFTKITRVDGKAQRITEYLTWMPEKLTGRGQITPQLRHRGIYEVPVYNAEIRLQGNFKGIPEQAFTNGATPQWDQATVNFILSDARALRSKPTLKLDEETLTFTHSEPAVLIPGTQLVLQTDQAESWLKSSQHFDINLHFGGSQTLQIIPAGDETSVLLASPWADPSFQGAYLPTKRSISETGFSAEWKMLALGRGFPQSWGGHRYQALDFSSSAFGVNLFQPIDIYRLNDRAIKYALLLAILIFSTMFLLDMLNAQRLHIMNHLLVGAALACFFLLLLALGEHIGFAPAYLLSAIAATLMITGYAHATLHSPGAWRWLASSLGITFGAIYVVLNAEEYSLLFGAIMLFALLGSIMLATRNMDWRAKPNEG